MSYSHTTFGQLKTALAYRLGDSGGVYWLNGADSGSTAELGMYIKEALRTWGLLTGYWRDSATVNTVANTAFYNISTVQNGNSEDLLSYTVLDSDLIYMMQYHLLEPATGTSWTGSEQFTLTDVTDALTRRRNRLLLESESVITQSTQVLGAGKETFTVPDTVVLLRDVHWKGTVSGIDWAVNPTDIGFQRNFSVDYLTTQAIPSTYSSSTTVPLEYIIAPPPGEPGTLTLLSINSGAALTAGGVALGVPDDMSWIVKWGAMADLLGRDGPARDPVRAAWCERRYNMAVGLARTAPVILNIELNGVAADPDTFYNVDTYDPNWVTNTGVPKFVASMGNYIGVSPCPNGVYSIGLDVVRKAPVPTLDADFIQIGREYIDILIDYAYHLATFKMGGMEFEASFRAAQNFFDAAALYNTNLSRANPAAYTLKSQSTDDLYPRRLMTNKAQQVSTTTQPKDTEE